MAWHSPKNEFPEQYTFAKNKNLSLHKAIHSDQMYSFFNTPCSDESCDQYIKQQGLVAETSRTDDPDGWTYIWRSGLFSCTKAYIVFNGHREIHI